MSKWNKFLYSETFKNTKLKLKITKSSQALQTFCRTTIPELIVILLLNSVNELFIYFCTDTHLFDMMCHSFVSKGEIILRDLHTQLL